MSGLRTPRLALRPVASADADRLRALLVLPGVRRFLLDDQVVEPAFVEALLTASAASFARRGFGFWALDPVGAPPPDDALLGLVGLRLHVAARAAATPGAGDAPRAAQADDPVELLYAIHPSRWGEGLAVEASRAALRHAFCTCGLRRVLGETDEANFGSVRVLEKLGMRRLRSDAGRPRPAAHGPGAASDPGARSVPTRFQLRREDGYAAC